MHVRRRDIVLFFGMLAVCCGACIAVFHNAGTRIYELRADSTAKLKSIDEVQRSTDGADALQVRIDQLQATVTAFDQSLPPQAQMDSVLTKVSMLAGRQGLNVERIATLSVSPAGDYVEETIELTVAGSFDDFYAFLLKLEKQSGQPRIAQMTMAQSADNETSVRSDLRIGLLLRPTGMTATTATMFATTQPLFVSPVSSDDSSSSEGE